MSTFNYSTRNGKNYAINFPDAPALANAGMGKKAAAVKADPVVVAAKAFIDTYFKGAVSAPLPTIDAVLRNSGSHLRSTVDSITGYANSMKPPGISRAELSNFETLSRDFKENTFLAISGMKRLVELNKGMLQAADHKAYCDAFVAIRHAGASNTVNTNLNSFIGFISMQKQVLPAANVNVLIGAVRAAGDQIEPVFGALTSITASKSKSLTSEEIKIYAREVGRFATVAPGRVGIAVRGLADLLVLAGPLPDTKMIATAIEALHAIIETSPVKGAGSIPKFTGYCSVRKGIPPADELKVIKASSTTFDEEVGAFCGILSDLTELNKGVPLTLKTVQALKALADEHVPGASAALKTYVALVKKKIVEFPDSIPAQSSSSSASTQPLAPANSRALTEFSDAIATIASSNQQESLIVVLKLLCDERDFTPKQLYSMAESIDGALDRMSSTSVEDFTRLMGSLIKHKMPLPTLNELESFLLHFSTVIGVANDEIQTIGALQNLVTDREYELSVGDVEGLAPILITAKGLSYNQIDMLMSAEKMHGGQFEAAHLCEVAEACIKYEPQNESNPFDDDEYESELTEFFEENSNLPFYALCVGALRYGRENGFHKLRTGKAAAK